MKCHEVGLKVGFTFLTTAW